MTKPKQGWLSYVKQMARVNGQVVLPDVPNPRKRFKRAKETAPRRQEEAAFRNILIPHLRRKGCKVIRIENSIGGRHNIGIADLLVFCESTNWGGFVELKAEKGILSDEQEEIQRLCALCGIKYLVVKTLEEAERIYRINIS
ncbi:MAG: hypothetical protein AAB456_03570 [Patescibacteria group bacterium]